MFYSVLGLLLLSCSVILALFIQKLRDERRARSRDCELPVQISTWNPISGPGTLIDTARLVRDGILLETTKARFRKYGKTFETRYLGTTTIHTMDRENVQAIFATSGWDFGVAPQRMPVREALGHGIITTDGAAWEQARALIKPSLEKVHIEDFSTLETEVQKLFAVIGENEGKVDMQSLLFDLYFNVAWEFLFGGPVAEVPSKDIEEFRNDFQASIRGAGIRMVLGPLSSLLPSREWRKACNSIKSFAKRYVDEIALPKEVPGASVANKQRHNISMMHRIAQKTTDKRLMQDLVLNGVFAVEENVGLLMSNAIFVLARSKGIWARLKADVDAVSGQKLNFETLESMKYMQYFLHEVMRMYPMLFKAPRSALKDTFLPRGGGADGSSRVFVPAGTQVLPYMSPIANDPDLWGEDAEEFRPERWENTRLKSAQFAAFGGGSRGCLGRRKAFMDASYFLTRVIQEYDAIEPEDDKPYKHLHRISIRNANGCKVRFKGGSM